MHVLRLTCRAWREQVDAALPRISAPRQWWHIPSAVLQRLSGLTQLRGLLLGSPSLLPGEQHGPVPCGVGGGMGWGQQGAANGRAQPSTCQLFPRARAPAGLCHALAQGTPNLQSLQLGLGGGHVAPDALDALGGLGPSLPKLTSLQLLGPDMPTGEGRTNADHPAPQRSGTSLGPPARPASCLSASIQRLGRAGVAP